MKFECGICKVEFTRGQAFARYRQHTQTHHNVTVTEQQSPFKAKSISQPVPHNVSKLSALESFRAAVKELMRDYHIVPLNSVTQNNTGLFVEAVIESAKSILLGGE